MGGYCRRVFWGTLQGSIPPFPATARQDVRQNMMLLGARSFGRKVSRQMAFNHREHSAADVSWIAVKELNLSYHNMDV